MRKLIIAGLIVVFCFLARPTYSVLFTASGLSAKNVPVSFEADMTIVGDILTIILRNTSPVNSLNPDDTLGSFYFDIVNAGNSRPTLTYLSAIGDVYLGDKTNPDPLQASNANIKAVNTGDYSWMFKLMTETQNPYFRFGIGTVGNSNLTPNNFQGGIVDGLNYSIYRNEITTTNLDSILLVKNTATFKFTGLTGFTTNDIAPRVKFGLGTMPDSTMESTIPEPAMIGIISLALLGFFRKHKI